MINLEAEAYFRRRRALLTIRIGPLTKKLSGTVLFLKENLLYPVFFFIACLISSV